jgi:hypothetical protein
MYASNLFLDLDAFLLTGGYLHHSRTLAPTALAYDD